MIYLAAPYSDPDPAVREFRFLWASRYTAACLRAGVLVYSPLSHGHAVAVTSVPASRKGEPAVPTDIHFWKRHAKWFIQRCEKVVVLMLPGWEKNDGVEMELNLAEEFSKTIEYAAPDEFIRQMEEVSNASEP